MNKAEFEAMIKDLEGELGLLKSRYEQWIQGIERIPPMRQKERLERRLRQLRREQPNNTAMRYRFQAVFSRWTTMNTYWQRITRQIEEGTFRRDVKKAKQRRKKIEAQEARASQPEAAAAAANAGPLELDLDADFDSEIAGALAALELPKAPQPVASPPAESPPLVSKRFGRPVARSRISQPPEITGTPAPPAPPSSPQPGRHRPVPPPPPSRGRAAPPPPPPPPPGRRAAPPPPPRSSPTTPTVSPRAVTPRAAPRTPAALRSAPKPAAGRSSLSDRDLQRVYDKYVSAKKQNNERVDNLSREKLAKKIRAMEPKLRQKYGSANVDFEVVVKGGRVGLKPKKKS